MVERLKLYIESRGMITTQFADAIGMPRSSFSQLLTGRNKSISDVTIGKIHAAFPDLSISWLLFGEGTMRTGVADTRPIEQQQSQLSIFDENKILTDDVEVRAKYGKEIEVDAPTLLEAVPSESMASEPRAPFYHVPRMAHGNNKVVSKIMVFYSDNTYETFIAE